MPTDSGIELHWPRVAVYHSDALAAPARRLIEEHFGIEVLTFYSAVEAATIGFECERHMGLHLNCDLNPVRIVGDDGEELPDGESGEVVVSNLVNRATVLLNYRLGDVAAKLPGPCPCGRSLPLLSFLEGRVGDWIRARDGEAVHPQAVRTLFTEEEHVWRYQVVQRSLSHFAIALVTAPECDRPRLAGPAGEELRRPVRRRDDDRGVIRRFDRPHRTGQDSDRDLARRQPQRRLMAAKVSRRDRLAWTARMVWEAPRQARFPFRSEEEIRRAQQRRIGAVVAHAGVHVPYYRDTFRRLGLDPAAIRTAADLARLPLLERRDVQRDPEYFRSRAWPLDACVPLQSGGSTGEPLTFFRDPASFPAEAAQRERHALAGQTGSRGADSATGSASILPLDSSGVDAARAVRGNTLIPAAVRRQRRLFSIWCPPQRAACRSSTATAPT